MTCLEPPYEIAPLSGYHYLGRNPDEMFPTVIIRRFWWDGIEQRWFTNPDRLTKLIISTDWEYLEPCNGSDPENF